MEISFNQVEKSVDTALEVFLLPLGATFLYILFGLPSTYNLFEVNMYTPGYYLFFTALLFFILIFILNRVLLWLVYG